MPIVDLDTDYLDQQCANCAATRRFARPSLDTAEGVFEPTEDPFVLALPPCARCGAREFLIRSRDEGSDEPQRHQHLVNRLFGRLRQDGELVAATESPLDAPAVSPVSTQGGT